MFTKRLISGIILVILAIIIVGQGGILLYGTMTAISLIGMYELYRVLNMEKSPLAVIGYLTAAAYYGLVWFEGTGYVTLLAIGALMVMMSLYVFQFPRGGSLRIFRSLLCGSHAFLSLSGKSHGGRKVPGVADLFKLLGL